MQQLQGKPGRNRSVLFKISLITAVMVLFLGASLASAANVLLVVGNARLVRGDLAIQDRLILNGYDVIVARDYKDVTDEILVVISASTGSRKGAKEGAKKYAAAKTPVICLNPLLYGDLGMTGTRRNIHYGSALTNGKINLIDTYHYVLSADTPLGLTKATRGSSSMGWGVPGDRAIRVGTLIKNGERYPFFAYWRGSPMPGMPEGAPGKRVGLFLPQNGPQLLTDDGWALFESAVVWSLPNPLAAGGAGNGPALSACTPAQMSAYCVKCQGDTNYGCCTKDNTCISEISWDDNCNFTSCSSGCDGACDARNLQPNFDLAACTPDDGPSGKCMSCGDGTWCCKENGSCFAANTWCPFVPGCGDPGKCSAANLCVKKAVTECPKWTHKLTFANSSSETIWLGVNPSKYGSRRWDYPSPGGWKIDPGSTQDVTVAACWSGNFFIRTGCNFDKNGEHCTKEPCCQTGDCRDAGHHSAFTTCTDGGKPPATLVEFTFDGGLDVSGKKLGNLEDNYDVSLVDGWTKMVTIVPNGTNFKTRASDERWCTQAGCGAKLICPDTLKMKDSNKADTGYCYSPCTYATLINSGFSLEEQAKYCCVCSKTVDIACTADTANEGGKCYGDGHFGCSPYSTPGSLNPLSQCCPFTYTAENDCIGNKDDPSRVWAAWAQSYVTNIKGSCSKAYTWQYDDHHSMFKCQASTETAVNYTITISDGS
jgi:hypothetical protein